MQLTQVHYSYSNKVSMGRHCFARPEIIDLGLHSSDISNKNIILYKPIVTVIFSLIITNVFLRRSQ